MKEGSCLSQVVDTAEVQDERGRRAMFTPETRAGLLLDGRGGVSGWMQQTWIVSDAPIREM